MYNNRRYINIMFMYIYYAQHIHMYVHHLRCKDHRCSAKPPKTLFCSHKKRCRRKRSKLAVWEASAREVGHGLRYRLLQKAYQQTAKEQQYLQYPKRDPKKGVSLWLHNTACLVILSFSNFHLLIQKQTWEKNNWRSQKKKVFVTPLKILKIHLFWVPAIHFPGCALPFTSDRCSPPLCYYAIMPLCYYAFMLWLVSGLMT